MISKKKNILSHYLWFFIWRVLLDTFFWTIFAILFIVLGKKYADIDILGKIFQFFGEDWKFSQYFIGNGLEEKSDLLNYALYFIIIIISLNFISLLYNRYLWKKDQYIENNNFYLHSRWIFVINTFIHIASAFLLTFSFTGALPAILALVFIIFNSQKFSLAEWKKKKSPQTEKLFSWQNQHIRKIFIYSAIVVLALPFIIGKARGFYEKVTASSPTGFARSFKELLDTSPTIKKIINMLLAPDSTSDILHWFIFLWFTRGIIFERIQEFGDFWNKVNSITKRVTNYCHYYYYKESWAIANNSSVNLGDYSYIENIPSFLSKSNLEKDLDIENFAEQNQKVVKYIQFCENKVKESAKKNFLYYCLFNEFGSYEDCLRTKKLIDEKVKRIT